MRKIRGWHNQRNEGDDEGQTGDIAKPMNKVDFITSLMGVQQFMTWPTIWQIPHKENQNEEGEDAKEAGDVTSPLEKGKYDEQKQRDELNREAHSGM